MAAVTFFKWIACSTVMATLLVILVLLIKLIFKNKPGARWHYFLWTLVLLKLLIPYGPESKLSIYNLFDLTNNKITAKSYDVMNTISTATTTIAKSTPIPYSNSLSYIERSSAAAHRDRTIYLSILGILIWFTGAASMGVHIIKRNIKLNNELKIGRSIDDAELINCLEISKKSLHIKSDIKIMEVYNINTPALYGILSPVLLIPVNMLQNCSTVQLKYAIMHELAHLKRKDIPMNLLLSALIVIHWFNPIIWYAFYKMRQDAEMACDELVLSHLSGDEQKGYGLTLIHLVEVFSSNFKLANAVGFIGNKSFIKKRILKIAAYKKRSVRISVFAVLIFAVLFLAAFTNAIDKLNIGTGF
jgi:bla regulator protein BlaR1